VLEVTELAEVIKAFPAEPAPRGFKYFARGRCSTGYTAGDGESESAVDVATCAAACLQDPNCKYFSLLPNHALTAKVGGCARFDMSAEDCRDRIEDWRYNTYERAFFASSSFYADGICANGFYAGDTLPNGAMNASWCSELCTREECHFFSVLLESPTGGHCYRYKVDAGKNCTIRTDESVVYKTYRRAPKTYSYVGEGPCKNPKKSKTVQNQLVSLSTCAATCSKDPNCTFFSLRTSDTSHSLMEISNTSDSIASTSTDAPTLGDEIDSTSSSHNASSNDSKILTISENLTLKDVGPLPDVTNELELTRSMAPHSIKDVNLPSLGTCTLFVTNGSSCTERLPITGADTFRKIDS